MNFFLFWYGFSLEMDEALHLNKQIPFNQNCFEPRLVKIGHLQDTPASGEEDNFKKFSMYFH